MKKIIFSLVGVVIVLAIALPAAATLGVAQPLTWPTAANWTHPAVCYCDPTDQPPGEDYLDLIGCYNDGTYDIGPAVFYYFDNVNGYAYFRERVKDNPSKKGGPPGDKFKQNAWVVVFDLPAPGNYEYILGVDGNAEEVQLWENTDPKALVWDPILKDKADTLRWSNSTATYAQIQSDGTGHWFVDWAIPITELTSRNITENTTMYFCTSADAQNYNKDYLDCYKPDLTITEKSEAWVSLEGKSYNVTYTVCNNGGALAGASNATITIDGLDVMEDPVPELSPSACYTNMVGPFNMTGNSDTIKVCADNGGVVLEIDEDNNCLENTFACEPPVADFVGNPTSGCAPSLIVTFTDQSTGSPTSWNWTFLGGSPSSYTGQAPPPVTYNSPGTYDVTLTVSNDCGSDSETGYITATGCDDGDPCTTDTCVNGTCVNTPINCDDEDPCTTDTCVNGTCVNTPINCDDEDPCTIDSCVDGECVHIPKDCDDGDPCTIDTCVDGECVHTLMPAPTADFTADNRSGCAPLPVLFTDSSTGATSWSWSFPGGSPSSHTGQTPPSVTYNSPGTYTVSLTVSNGCGSTSTTDYITVEDCGPGPTTLVLVPETDSNLVGTTHNLTATVYDQFGYVMEGVAVTWSISGVGSFFGTPEGVTDANGQADAVITSSEPGISTVKCEVTGNPSVSDTATKTWWTLEPAVATTLELWPSTGSNRVNTTHALIATVYDQFHNVMAGVPLTWNITGAGNFSGTPQGVTSADGKASAVITSNVTGISTVGCAVATNTSIFATATKTWTTTPSPTPGGGGGTCPTFKYLTVDWDETITQKRLYRNNRLTVDLLGPSSNGSHSLLLERGTLAPTANGKRHYLIVIRELEETPPPPENTIAVVAFNVTPEDAVFDRDIFLTLGLDELPENALNATMAYYDDVNGVWVPLDSEPVDPNGVAELILSAPINHFSIFGVLVEVAPPPPPPAPAHFVPSGLNIVTSVEKIWEPVTFVTKTGESVTITANVLNDGGQKGPYTVELKLNGETVDTKTLTLGAGQSQQVSFTVSGLDYGQYEVKVAGLSGEFTTSRTITWWLIIVIIAAIGLIIWGVVWRRRRRKAHKAA